MAALFERGAQGVQDGEDFVLTHFPPGSDLDAVCSALQASDPEATVETWAVPETDWSRAWRDGIRAHRLGRLTIAPPWLAHDLDAETAIIIDPGMAFGTGEHATTRGVVRLLQGVIREGDSVADLGAGSAVLAIAAARLGARSVFAIELDPDAIPNAEFNVRANSVADRVVVLEGDAALFLPLVAPVRVVIANIISSVLASILPHIRQALTEGGVAILSGMLQEERERMLALFSAEGWAVEGEDSEDAWWSVSLRPVEGKER